MSIFYQSYHLISYGGRLLLHFIKLLLLCQLLLTLRGVAVEEQPGTPIQITDDDIQQILDAHNFFRSIVEPPASNMQRIRWSSLLATVAQSYAEMCMFGLNPDRTAQAAELSFNNSVGENRAFGRTTNYTDLIDRGWFIRRLNFNFSSNACLSPGACDEYIQLVWAESNLVGCGAANCETVTGLSLLTNAVVFVCNYAPEGNIPGEQPYMAGEPCSNCPPNLPLCIDNLCSSPEDIINDTTTTALQPPMTSTTSSTPVTSATASSTTTPPGFVEEEETSDETSRDQSGQSGQSNRND